MRLAAPLFPDKCPLSIMLIICVFGGTLFPNWKQTDCPSPWTALGNWRFSSRRRLAGVRPGRPSAGHSLPAQVSKLIARLEDRLNSRLFNRTTRDVSLTDEGRALHARARVLVEEYDQLERSAQETAKPRGLLKLSAPISFGQQLGPALIDFASTYPDVALDVSFTD